MKIVILGNGGHSRVIQEMIFSIGLHSIEAVLDDKYDHVYQENGITYGPILLLNGMPDPELKLIVALGDNRVRKEVIARLNLESDRYITIIHPTAVVSRTAKIGNGTVVMPQAVINAGAVVGEHCIINTRAIVEHDNQIGNYTHLSPNATLTGSVRTGEGVHIGASATIIPGMEIGSWSIVGAGSTVIKMIPPYSKAVGSPSRIIQERMVT